VTNWHVACPTEIDMSSMKRTPIILCTEIFCIMQSVVYYAVIKKIEHIEERMCTKCFLIHQKSELIRTLASGERETPIS
jgi:hypothetical protein